MITVRADPVTAQEFDEPVPPLLELGPVGCRRHQGRAEPGRAGSRSRRRGAGPRRRDGVVRPGARHRGRPSDNPAPALHYMTNLPRHEHRAGTGLGVASDFLGLECHGEVQSHLDALCHIAFDGHLFNGWPAGLGRTDGGAARGGLEVAAQRHRRRAACCWTSRPCTTCLAGRRLRDHGRGAVGRRGGGRRHCRVR